MDDFTNTPVRVLRDEAFTRATEAADTIEGVSPAELISEGCIDSALNALEDARDKLIAIQVKMDKGPLGLGQSE